MQDLPRFGFVLDRQHEWRCLRIDASILGVLFPAAFIVTRTVEAIGRPRMAGVSRKQFF
jgi:hypothetical protein